ncbi:MAG: signal peptide peptidase SppA [Desulfotignum sp.]|nr:signal peptide peptidase SppA [Desulfotignum sp.]MCF8112524.1 signal peptide peptidase SppA [Desulfotignum sp.]MCF8124730.1 signal peptide peptidase SppA [Desulfotignum sp.]
MFSRRHPVLFFLIIMAACATVMFLGVVVLLFAGSRMMTATTAAFDESGGNIGIIEVTGPILSSKQVIENIQTFREDDKIQAIIIRVDSPGGGIGPSQEIFRELMKTRKVKKIIASMGSVAASGGYYVAAAAQKIVANPGTITGSIGVIMEYVNIMELAEKIGISPVVIKSGEFKDMGSPLRKLGDNEKKLLQQLVDELHLQFVSDAALARNMSEKDMAALADGRIYTGQTALDLNLIDRLGNLDDAVQWAGELAEIDGKLVPVYPKETPISLLRKIAQTLFKDLNISGTITDNLRYIVN